MAKRKANGDQTIVNFMAQHFVPLMVRLEHYYKDGSFRQENTTVISGFIMELDGQWYWTTAGHCLKDLDDGISEKILKVIGGDFVDHIGTGAIKQENYPFQYEPGRGFYVYDKAEGLDFALIPLDSLTRRNFELMGRVPIQKRTWIHTPNDKFDFYKMLGIPQSQVRTSEEDEDAISFTPVMAAFVPIDPASVKDQSVQQWLVGEMPARSKLNTVVGMSGGPIFGFRYLPDGGLAYHLVALQSSWIKPTDVVMACPIPYFMNVFRQTIPGANFPVIHVESRRKKIETIQNQYPDATIVDVTSKSAGRSVKFSPFYPHGNIPIPGTDLTGQSIEGIWQGLKVFEKEGVDPKKWAITNMKGIKRSGTSRGKVLGHRFGDELLGYLEARRKIYLPIYRWVLENKLQAEVEELRRLFEHGDLVLLDETSRISRSPCRTRV